MSIKVKLQNFEGPFDLLLYLVRKNEVNIWDIPITEIIRQYLEYIHLMQLLDLEVAGEFIEMVAELILIKTRMLLPQEPGENEEEAEDPVKNLAIRILEYARFKDASFSLEQLESLNYYQIPHSPPDITIEKTGDDLEVSLAAITFFDLLTAFKTVLQNRPRIIQHEVETIKVTTESQSRYLLRLLEKRKSPVFFGEILKQVKGKVVLIVTFLSILDLMKVGLISVVQTSNFHDFQIVPLKEQLVEEFEKLHQQRMGAGNVNSPEEQN